MEWIYYTQCDSYLIWNKTFVWARTDHSSLWLRENLRYCIVQCNFNTMTLKILHIPSNWLMEAIKSISGRITWSRLSAGVCLNRNRPFFTSVSRKCSSFAIAVFSFETCRFLDTSPERGCYWGDLKLKISRNNFVTDMLFVIRHLPRFPSSIGHFWISYIIEQFSKSNLRVMNIAS